MNDTIQELAAEIEQDLAAVHWKVRRHEIGRIVRAGDGVAYLRGAPSVRYGELLQKSDGLTALAFDLRRDEVGVLFLDSSEQVGAGDELRATGRVASVTVGDELLSRVIDALGRPLDDGPPIRAAEYWPVEREAPGVIERQPVREPMHTGTKVIDTLLPLGRGQRELILGDRATGKTAIALDAILAQRDSDVVCVYAAIGQRKASIAETVGLLRKFDALKQTVVVVAEADSPAGQQYLAPFTACTIGEYFMHQGRHALVVFDDLTKHADAYRRISLLLNRPPGREAYPPDIFYLHARLLERATRLHDALGGGSLTALPIASTQAGNIASYIPTNLISITDGQIYLDTRLFNEGQRPAVDVGLSVSRVGSKAQPQLLRADQRSAAALLAIARAGDVCPLRRGTGAGNASTAGARPPPARGLEATSPGAAVGGTRGGNAVRDSPGRLGCDRGGRRRPIPRRIGPTPAAARPRSAENAGNRRPAGRRQPQAARRDARRGKSRFPEGGRQMTLEATQHRRRAVGTIHDIVGAMRAIAAGRIQGAQRALASSHHYEDVVLRAILSLARDAARLPLFPPQRQVTLLLVMTSEQPLCGTFNQGVLSLAERRLHELREKGETRVVVVGHRGARHWIARGLTPDVIESAATSVLGLHDMVKRLAVLVDQQFAAGSLGELRTIYNRYQSISQQVPTEQQILPIDLERLRPRVRP